MIQHFNPGKDLLHSAFTCTAWSDYSHSSTMLLNQTTANVRVYMPVRKSNYWLKHVIPRYDRWRCTQRSQRLTSLCHQPPRHPRKISYEERADATSLYISYKVYMIITQTSCTMALSLAVILEERRRRCPCCCPCRCPRRCHHPPSTSGSQNAKSDPI